jgi:hypothetical protein
MCFIVAGLAWCGPSSLAAAQDLIGSPLWNTGLPEDDFICISSQDPHSSVADDFEITGISDGYLQSIRFDAVMPTYVDPEQIEVDIYADASGAPGQLVHVAQWSGANRADIIDPVFAGSMVRYRYFYTFVAPQGLRLAPGRYWFSPHHKTMGDINEKFFVCTGDGGPLHGSEAHLRATFLAIFDWTPASMVTGVPPTDLAALLGGILPCEEVYANTGEADGRLDIPAFGRFSNGSYQRCADDFEVTASHGSRIRFIDVQMDLGVSGVSNPARMFCDLFSGSESVPQQLIATLPLHEFTSYDNDLGFDRWIARFRADDLLLAPGTYWISPYGTQDTLDNDLPRAWSAEGPQEGSEVLVRAPSLGITEWEKLADVSPALTPRVDIAFSVCGVDQPSPSSIANWNGDGAVNSSDFLDFLNSWSNQEPRADLAPFGGDAAWDSSDFLTFLNAYAQAG